MKTDPSTSLRIATSSIFLTLLLSGCPANDTVLGTDSCQKEGKTYKIGDTVPLDTCASCVCQKDGTVGLCTNHCAPDGGLDTGTGDSSVAALTLNISGINVGTVVLGKSATATVVVTNKGAAPSGALVVTPGADVAVSGCTTVLAAGASCALTITATPKVAGPFNSQVSVSAKPGAASPLVVSVTGDGAQPGQLSATPLAIDFGTVQLGIPSTKMSITVAALTALGDLSVSTSSAEVSIVDDTCTPATLATGATCTLGVTFIAKTSGAKIATVAINAGGTDGTTVVVVVSAIAQDPVPPARFAVSPAAIDFGTLQLGVPSTKMFINVAALTALDNLSVTSSSAEVSIVDDTCTAAPVAAGATCTLGVTFTAKTNGARIATVAIKAGGVDGMTVSVAVTALAQDAAQPDQFSATPAALDFGTLRVGVPGTAMTVIVAAATTLVDLSVRSSSAEVLILDNTCTGMTLAAGKTCTIGVNVVATSAGAKHETVVVQSGGANGKAVSIEVSAVAQNPVKLVITPAVATLSTTVGSTSEATVFTVANASDVASGSLQLSVSGVNAAEFIVTSNACLLLEPSATCTFSVVFTPKSAGAAVMSAALVVADSGQGGTAVSAALSGTLL